MMERSLAWLASDRRLQVRCERHADILLGSCTLHARCSASSSLTSRSHEHALGTQPGGTTPTPVWRRVSATRRLRVRCLAYG